MHCLHGLYILQADRGNASVYRTVNKFLSEGYAVIYAVEEHGTRINSKTPKVKLINHIYSNMKQSQLIEDIEGRIETGALTIADVREMYSPHNIATEAMLKKWVHCIESLRKKGNFENVAVISGGVTVFSDANNQDKLVEYEQAILDAVQKMKSVRVICCYLQESVDKFQFAQLLSIVNAHQCSVGRFERGEESRRLDSSVMLDAISDGIENVMGEGSSKLVMQTVKTVYRMNEETLLSNPPLFQEKLQKLLGNSSKAVLDSASKSLKQILLSMGIVLMIVGCASSSMMLL